MPIYGACYEMFIVLFPTMFCSLFLPTYLPTYLDVATSYRKLYASA